MASSNQQPLDSADWLQREVDYLAALGSRRTASAAHNQLIDRIQEQLEDLGLQVHTDVWTFDYDDTSLSPGRLHIDGVGDTAVSSAVPYSGHTPQGGFTGKLIDLIDSPYPPDWSRAAGNIAVVSIRNLPVDRNVYMPIWDGSPPWNPGAITGVPSSVANPQVANLSRAKDAGVLAIIYAWEGISDRLAARLYAPFHNPYFDIPALYVSGRSAELVRVAAAASAKATLTLEGRLIPGTPTRTIWTVIRGTELPREAVIINTHTDGTNLVEENGHLAMLQYAKSLVDSPPRRTVILAFVTAHIHSAPFSNTKRSTTRWLLDNPRLWKGSAPDGFKAVFGTCVEHLGAVAYEESLEANRYVPAGKAEDEYLFAATRELADITLKHWNGADPNVTRVLNPNVGPMEQPGEGLPLYHARIPEISLITAPTWLLNEFPAGFDERTLMDVAVTRRQIESLERIWREVDGLDADALGVVPGRG